MLKTYYIEIPTEYLVFTPNNRVCVVEGVFANGISIIHSMKFEGVTGLGFTRDGALKFIDLVKTKIQNGQH